MPENNFAYDETLASLIDKWQATGDADTFALLWSAAASTVCRSARLALARSDIRDPAAVEDAISLVLDHLRRLPEGAVAKYRQDRSAANYLSWLARQRAKDVIRGRRRRREKVWPELPDVAAPPVDFVGAEEETTSRGELLAALADAVAALDERSRNVIQRHLAGDKQGRIAKDLGVCEGTVTRIRQRAMERLGGLLRKAGQACQSRDMR